MAAGVVLFGLLGAIVAALSASGLAAACLVSAGSAVTLTALALRTPRPFALPWRLVGGLAVLNLAQIGFYYLALKLAPVGPAAALHLAAPVLLVGYALARRRRTLDARALLTLALLVGALALAGATSGGAGGSRSPLLGLAFALLSAAAMAAMITVIFRQAERMSLVAANASKAWLGALALAPALAFSSPTLHVTLGLLGAGALLAAPGLVLVWWALARVSPQITSIIDLGEAVVTPAAGAALFGLVFTLLHAAIMLPLLAAVWLELSRKRDV